MFDFLFGNGNKEQKNDYWDALGNKAEAKAYQAILGELLNSDDEETKKYLSDMGVTSGTLAESVRKAEDTVKAADAALGQGQLRLGSGSIDLPGGIIGSLLSPVFRLSGDVASNIAGKGEEYKKWNDRDVLSTIGDIATLATLAPGVGVMSSGASLGTKALAGAGLGAVSNAADYLGSTRASNRDFGDFSSSAGLGAAFGGGIPALGAVGGKLGRAVTNRGVDAIANQAVQQGYAPELARQIAQNTSKASQAAAGLGQVMRSKPFKIGAGAVAGGTLLSNLMGNRNANQTGYNDDATYGSDLYGTTQGYNYGTYGY